VDGRFACKTLLTHPTGIGEKAMDPTADRDRSDAPDAGATAVEYALIVFAIAAVIVAIVIVLGGTVNNMFSNSCAAINSEGTTTVATTDCG
jgi:pilus assembly protein Flp/PilA